MLYNTLIQNRRHIDTAQERRKLLHGAVVHCAVQYVQWACLLAATGCIAVHWRREKTAEKGGGGETEDGNGQEGWHKETQSDKTRHTAQRYLQIPVCAVVQRF